MRPRLAAVLGEGEAPGDRAELDAAVRAFFEAVSDQGTTVLVFEDLHWADPALIDFVEDLTDWWRDRPILIVTMARPDLLELKPSWGTGRQGVVSITLGPMSSEDMLTLVHGAVPGIPQSSAEAIVDRAAGIPLYAVELLRGLLAQGQLAGEAGDYRVVGDLTQLVIPESLQAVIGARLDRLGADERALIQDAAVLGQTFNITGLAALTGQDTAEVEMLLHSLSRRELIEPVRDPRAVERGQYRFLQGLIRDVRVGPARPGGPAHPAPRRGRALGGPRRPGVSRDRRRALPACFGSVTGWRSPRCHPRSGPCFHGARRSAPPRT